MTKHRLVDDDGVRVCGERCPTCIFRPGNLMYLKPGRVKEMVTEATADGESGSIVCHDTLDDPKQAICRGFWDSYQDRVQLLQVAGRMGFVKLIWKKRP